MHVADAQPGDTLRIDVLDVQVAEWGWSAILPGFGLLLDEYASPVLKIWTLHRNEGEGEGYGYAWFDEAKGIKIPLRPFAGEMGVAPGKDGAHSTIPPYKTGGNVDTRHLKVVRSWQIGRVEDNLVDQIDSWHSSLSYQRQ